MHTHTETHIDTRAHTHTRTHTHTNKDLCILIEKVVGDTNSVVTQTVAIMSHPATRCNTLHRSATLQHTTTHYKTLQHAATRCNTLQHAATRCNLRQQTCAYALRRQLKEVMSGVTSPLAIISIILDAWLTATEPHTPAAFCNSMCAVRTMCAVSTTWVI